MALTITHPEEHRKYDTSALSRKLFEAFSELPADVVIEPAGPNPDRYLVYVRSSDGTKKVSLALPALDAIAFEEYTGLNPALEDALTRFANDVRSEHLTKREDIAKTDYERLVSAFNPMGANYSM